jgi:type IV pilus assembly protein PilQ
LRKYQGKHITLQVKNAELADVFRLIGEASGFNIVLAPGVVGTTSLSLVDVPWDLALDTILTNQSLGAERNLNVLRINTLSAMTSEKQEQLRAKQAAEATAPKVTKIFPISYAKPKDLVQLLARFGSSQPQGGFSGSTSDSGSGTSGSSGQGASGSSSTGSFMVDERTNSIVVQDIQENIERIGKIIALLDTQTPQVLIEAKIVEAAEGFGSGISGGLGGGFSGNSTKYPSFFSVNGGNPVDPLIGTPGQFTDGASISKLSSGDAIGITTGFGIPSFKLLGATFKLNAFLTLNESESKSKLVSNPKMVVLNKEAANIVQGQPVAIPTIVYENGIQRTSVQVQSANLDLKVTPTVTSDGNILMDIDVSNDYPSKAAGSSESFGIAKRSIKTKVIAASGSTLVIGGILSSSTSEEEGGIPFLRKIPLIGDLLFGSKKSGGTRNELYIFITPRTLNEKESGIVSNGN